MIIILHFHARHEVMSFRVRRKKKTLAIILGVPFEFFSNSLLFNETIITCVNAWQCKLCYCAMMDVEEGF